MHNEIEQRLASMYVMGMFFGYPDCCRLFFLERSKRMLMGDFKTTKLAKNQQGYKQGFIPCQECADKIKPGEEGSLIKDRVCSSPYPQDNNTDEELNQFLEKLNLKKE